MAPVVAALGEVLWDVYPDVSHFGGAPANFACHAAGLGAEAWMVSAVGRDELGRRAITALGLRSVRTECVSLDAAHPTGRVSVSLNTAGVPDYKIAEDTAWDHITWNERLNEVAPRCNAACFGSLAQRSRVSRETIHQFLRTTRAEALRVFDINLRQQFYDRESLEDSLRIASVLKLNEDELSIVAEMFQVFGDSPREQLGALATRFQLRLVALTRGPRGAVLLSGSEIDDSPSPRTDVVDTVGAGDAFTAAIVFGFLRGLPLKTINRHANAVAAYVCSQRGATPSLPESLRRFE